MSKKLIIKLPLIEIEATVKKYILRNKIDMNVIDIINSNIIEYMISLGLENIETNIRYIDINIDYLQLLLNTSINKYITIIPFQGYIELETDYLPDDICISITFKRDTDVLQ